MFNKQFRARLRKSSEKLPVKSETRRAIHKRAGDTVTVRLRERIDKNG